MPAFRPLSLKVEVVVTVPVMGMAGATAAGMVAATAEETVAAMETETVVAIAAETGTVAEAATAVVAAVEAAKATAMAVAEHRTLMEPRIQMGMKRVAGSRGRVLKCVTPMESLRL
ncbi:serine protease inhibitor [Agrobacterium larrymoorei]|uniref:Serine protease inhibitor n=1 Tax=Agrobacterium larrymoorei TaxID=160699 RepID=A0AAJ2EQZ3_9HYPH|nr:hypothetical protein [Agrobacterium larrymoorei]MDR6101680.1 serine protease inhibitor [Agrobacterium larrymoorei]